MPQSGSTEQDVVEAARCRAAALAAGDEEALRRLMHPQLRWTTLKGEVLGYEEYISGNVGGGLVWRGQRLEDVQVSIARDTAILTARVIDEVSRDGRDHTFRVRLTQTWARTSGGWRCLAGHASAPTG